MRTILSEEEIEKVAKLCKENPYKAMDYAEVIFKELQMMTVKEFASKAKPSERTIYNMVSDVENADIEVAVFCDNKFIPGVLNRDLTNLADH